MLSAKVAVRVDVAEAYRDLRFVTDAELIPSSCVETVDTQALTPAARQALLFMERRPAYRYGMPQLVLLDPASLRVVLSRTHAPSWDYAVMEAGEPVDANFVAAALDQLGQRYEQLLPEYGQAVEAHRLRQEEQVDVRTELPPASPFRSAVDAPDSPVIDLATSEQLASAVHVWRFADAPECYRNLSEHGGDEDWVALIPPTLAGEIVHWMDTGTPFGRCWVHRYELPSGWRLAIGAHA